MICYSLRGTFSLAAVLLASALGSTAASADGAPAIWNGLYIGAHAGYSELIAADPFDLNGAVLGGQVGYNHQIGQFVVGIEGDVSGSTIEDGLSVTDPFFGQTISGSVRQNFVASIRARAGVAVDRALIYATLGYARTQLEVEASAFGVRFSETGDFDGVVAGGGVEYLFTSNLSGRVEGLGYRFDGDDGGDAYAIRAGLNYHFK